MFPQGAFRFPDFTKTRTRFGWNKVAKDEALVAYKTIKEKMTETGEIQGDLGEMWPETIMTTWFGKRVQHRRTMSWSEQINHRRNFPTVYGWTDEANAKTIYSELLDHQFRPPIEHDALSLMESYGGIDQWVLQNDPMFLTSWDMELMRNMLLVRRMELDKNFVMDRQVCESGYTKEQKSPPIVKETLLWIALTRGGMSDVNHKGCILLYPAPHYHKRVAFHNHIFFFKGD